MTPFNPALFVKHNTCLPCCTPNTPNCSCALIIPPFVYGGSPTYSSYSDAVTAITTLVASCIGYGSNGSGGALTTFTADNTTANTLKLDGALTATSADVEMLGSINLKAGDTLSAAWAVTFGGSPTSPVINYQLFKCDGTPVDNQNSSSGSGTFTTTVPADGEYVVYVIAKATSNTSTSANWTISSSGPLTVNPVIAQWDDSGTTRNLWACPKMLLPPNTEATGDFYLSCADAAAVLADAQQVSNCVGYCADNSARQTSFTATDGGSSLTLASTYSPAVSTSSQMWGGVNAVAGQTLSVAGTTSGGGLLLDVIIYNDDGTVFQNAVSVATPFVSNPLPYTGRYTVEVFLDSNPSPASDFTSCRATITSSGTMTVNQIQALYEGDPITNCPSRLSCGDTCP